MRFRVLLGFVAVAGSSFFAGALWAGKADRKDIESRIYSAADARTASGDWGAIHIYTEDGTPTYGHSSMLTAELEFLPHKQLQPPHQHAEEEFQYVIEGTGTWSLNGQEYPLKPGDLMYSKPWDWHGIRNSSNKPLRFLVFKWNNKGVAPPAKPSQATE